ncbi:MAG TPA: hypothetical protein VL125_17480 [Pelobium sp.]|nr:hypothetical protein [Pelobium sp.]
MKRNILIFLCVIFSSCSNDNSVYHIDAINKDGIILRKWHVLGLFKTEVAENGLETNYLNTDKDESAITYQKLKAFKPSGQHQNSHNQEVEINERGIADFNKIFDIQEDKAGKAVAYVACVIKSSKNQKLKLNFSSSDGAKIWLNHRLIFKDERGSGIHPYQNYVDIEIKQGDNLLLIKTANVEKQWVMFAGIEQESKEGIKRHKKNFELQYGNLFLSRNIIENDTIKLTWGIPENSYQLNILADKNLLLDIKPDQNINIGQLPDGFYKTLLYTPQDTFASRFYKTKSITSSFNEVIKAIEKSLAGKKNVNIDALLHRYNLLMKPENLPHAGFEKRSWDRRMLFILDNLKNEYHIINKENKPGELKGTLLRSYCSKIDSGAQYYILHVPEHYTKKQPVPLVIEMSKLMKWFPSPVETNRFANIDLIEYFSDMANKYNMIVAEPGGRTVDKPNYNNIDETDLWETIDDIKRQYNIDTNRIFLRGACRASYDALKMAVRYPGKFAAISTVAPEIIPNSTETNKNIWLHHNDPFNFLGNIKDMPFYNIHSVLDTHSRISSSEKLYQFIKKAGIKHFGYRKLANEFEPYYSDEYMDDIFSFFNNSRGIQQPKSLHFSTDQLKYNQSYWIKLNKITVGKTAIIDANVKNNTLSVERSNISSYTINLDKLPYDKAKPIVIYDNGKKVFQSSCSASKLTVYVNSAKERLYKNSSVEGPFSDIFKRPFMVVRNTEGNEEDLFQINRMVNKLNEDWEHRYYTKFRIKNDKEITAEDLSNFNLLFIGLPAQTGFLNKIRKYLPLSIGNKHISIGRQTIKGKNLGFYMIYPNPYNIRKYVAIIGFNNSNSFNIWSERKPAEIFNDISNYGWYDYKIWDNLSPTKAISGYFNAKWE